MLYYGGCLLHRYQVDGLESGFFGRRRVGDPNKVNKYGCTLYGIDVGRSVEGIANDHFAAGWQFVFRSLSNQGFYPEVAGLQQGDD
jgi:hypothetical protein